MTPARSVGGRLAGSRTPVVLVPGLSGDPARDFTVLAPMLRRHRHVQQVDLRHVRDVAGLDAAVASAVREVTADTGERAVLVGTSIGGTAAMRFATTGAHLLDRVVAVSAWLQPPDALAHFAAVWSTLRGERSTALQAVAAALLTSPAGRDRWRPLPESVVTDTLVAIAARLDAGDVSGLSASGLAVPALIISGDADAVATTRAGRLLAAAAGAAFHSVPGGHDLLAERPVQVLSHLTAFADGAPAPAAPSTAAAPAHIATEPAHP